MSVSFYFDVHVPSAITEQLRLRDVDVLTAQEDHAATRPDDELLTRATELVRTVVTYDQGFKALAEEWQRTGRTFAGLLFAQSQTGSIGDFVRDLELIAKASEPEDWRDVVRYLPLK